MAGVRKEFSWSKEYFVAVAKVWDVVPQRLGSYLVTLAVIAFGITVRGEWVIVAVHFLKQFGVLQRQANHDEFQPSQELSWRNISAQSFRLQNLHLFWIICNGIGFIMYFSVGGFLHWYWYVRQRDRPELWKCQAKWLSVDLERHEIMYGSRSLLIVNTVTSLLSCYIANGGWSTIYYQFDQYSWTWYFLQWPVIFIYQDYSTYLLHRLYHTPWLYKKFHKAHHKYVQPTAFSVTAIHPFEIVHTQLMAYCMPLFVFPTHWTSFTAIAIYTYYNGIIDHSGIDFKAPWWQPWRPDTIFHDNHHQYFHVNFGFNCFIWDKLHGTYRRTDRIYKEDIFYGKGKPLSEASTQELHEEECQRLEENPKAHRHMNPSMDQVQTIHKCSLPNKGIRQYIQDVPTHCCKDFNNARL